VETSVIPDWAVERRKMVDTQLIRRGIHDARVLAAMREIPREEFVPTESRVIAYSDPPIGIGYGQTISQPYMTALMAECLELTGNEHVLEVGAGCGYAAAVLGALAHDVVTVEIVPELAAQARRNLKRAGRDGKSQLRWTQRDFGSSFAGSGGVFAVALDERPFADERECEVSERRASRPGSRRAGPASRRSKLSRGGRTASAARPRGRWSP